VEREQSIYEQPRQRVDLLINAPSADVKEWIPVEIKAESFQNHTNFIPGVLDDLAKIERQRRHPFDQATSVMIAIAFSQVEEGSALKALMNIKVGDNPIFAVVHQGEIACCVAVWDGPSRGWIQQ
jgi:hypothetical protein